MNLRLSSIGQGPSADLWEGVSILRPPPPFSLYRSCTGLSGEAGNSSPRWEYHRKIEFWRIKWLCNVTVGVWVPALSACQDLITTLQCCSWRGLGNSEFKNLYCFELSQRLNLLNCWYSLMQSLKNILTQVNERQLLSLHSVFYLKLNSPKSKIFLNYFSQFLTPAPLTLYTQYCPISLNPFLFSGLLWPPS